MQEHHLLLWLRCPLSSIWRPWVVQPWLAVHFCFRPGPWSTWTPHLVVLWTNNAAWLTLSGVMHRFPDTVAPLHTGRSGWCWTPGPRQEHSSSGRGPGVSCTPAHRGAARSTWTPRSPCSIYIWHLDGRINTPIIYSPVGLKLLTVKRTRALLTFKRALSPSCPLEMLRWHFPNMQLSPRTHWTSLRQ